MILSILLTLLQIVLFSYPSLAIFIAAVMSTDSGKTRGFFIAMALLIIVWCVPLYFIWF